MLSGGSISGTGQTNAKALPWELLPRNQTRLGAGSEKVGETRRTQVGDRTEVRGRKGSEDSGISMGEMEATSSRRP